MIFQVVLKSLYLLSSSVDLSVLTKSAKIYLHLTINGCLLSLMKTMGYSEKIKHCCIWLISSTKYLDLDLVKFLTTFFRHLVSLMEQFQYTIYKHRTKDMLLCSAEIIMTKSNLGLKSVLVYNIVHISKDCLCSLMRLNFYIKIHHSVSKRSNLVC